MAGYEIESGLYDTAAQSAAPVSYDITVWYSMIDPPQARKNTILYCIILTKILCIICIKHIKISNGWLNCKNNKN